MGLLERDVLVSRSQSLHTVWERVLCGAGPEHNIARMGWARLPPHRQ